MNDNTRTSWGLIKFQNKARSCITIYVHLYQGNSMVEYNLSQYQLTKHTA